MTMRLVLIAGLAIMLACMSPSPRPIVYGSDQCAHCHMTIADPRYAAELVTRTGKVVVFDDIGCLAAFLAAGDVSTDAVHSAWAHDYVAPDAWMRTGNLTFVRSDSLRTPMGSGLIALAQPVLADSLRMALNGSMSDWARVLADAPAH